MCGRFAVTIDPALLAAKIDAINETVAETSAPNYSAPNYNVAPTTTIVTVVSRHDQEGDTPTLRVRLMRWGLVPPWVKAAADGTPEKKGPLLINARADKVSSSPVFRSAVKAKRCLVPMDGYYEWRADAAVPAGKKARKKPFYLHRADGEPMFVAGLWSAWRAGPLGHDSRPLLSCAIITTAAVGELAEIHDRMPLMIDRPNWDHWLNPDEPPAADLLESPPNVAGIRIRAVSTLVNSVRNNGPELIAPVDSLESAQPTLL